MARKQIIVKPVNIDLHQHNLDQFLRCPFKYYMANVAKYQVRGIKKALNIGDLFAKSVYHLHNGSTVIECMNEVRKLQEEIKLRAISQEKIDELETSVTIVQCMLLGYESQFLNKTSMKVTKFNERGGIEGFENIEIKKILPEYHIQRPYAIGNYHYNYINRLDGKVITELNPWLLELKTTSQIDKDLLIKLPTNFQINSYWSTMLAVEQQHIGGILYRYIRKPSIEQKKKETIEQFWIRLANDYRERPDFYFHEECLFFDENKLLSFMSDFKHYFEELTMCYVMNRWIRKGMACDSNFGLCEYLKYCSNPTDETLRTYYEQNN
jgi:hypothetical protein